MAQVALERITKNFPGNPKPAVNGIDLIIHDSEFIVLVGPSGCGKSTTLRMIAGLEDITSGTIRIGDRVVNDVAPKDRDIAMVFQNYALYPHMSVFDNMAFGLRMQRHKLGLTSADIKSRVMEAAKKLGLDELLHRKPRQLSGGQRQRVAVGRAIVRNPRAFLFDEPLSNLDAKLRVETRAQLKRLHLQLKTTTIYVTHDQEEAMTLGDRIVVMKDGVIHQCAAPLEVYERPANRFVAGFVGTPPMNFFDGRLERGSANGDAYFAFGGHRIRLGAAQAAIALPHAGQAMVLGVRPECLSPENSGAFGGRENSFEVKVNVVEPLGDKVDLFLSTGGQDHVVCRADAHRFGGIEVGATMNFFVNLDRIHLFQPGEDGVNISLAAERAGASKN
jgi:multiple sugar transport system ATP-binding protein